MSFRWFGTPSPDLSMIRSRSIAGTPSPILGDRVKSPVVSAKPVCRPHSASWARSHHSRIYCAIWAFQAAHVPLSMSFRRSGSTTPDGQCTPKKIHSTIHYICWRNVAPTTTSCISHHEPFSPVRQHPPNQTNSQKALAPDLHR